MSHNPPKNMYKDEAGVARFLDSSTAPTAGGGKRWYQVEITRRALDKEGETIDKDKQTAEVFATEDDAIGFAFSRCPNGLIVKEAFEFRTSVFCQPMRADDMFKRTSAESVEFLNAVEKLKVAGALA